MSEPTTLPTWATDPGADITVPAAPNDGWLAGDIPPRGVVNWFWNRVGGWLEYLRNAFRDVHGLSDWVLDGAARNSFKVVEDAPPSMFVEVLTNAGPTGRAVVSGRVVTANTPGSVLVELFAPIVPGSYQYQDLYLDTSGVVGVNPGPIGLSNPPAIPTDAPGLMPIARVLTFQGQTAIALAQITDRRKFAPITDLSVVPKALTRASIALATLTGAEVAPATLDQSHLVARSLNDLVKTRPALRVSVSPGVSFVSSGATFETYQAPLLTTCADGSPAPPEVFSAGGGPGVLVMAELYVEFEATIGAHGTVLIRQSVDAGGLIVPSQLANVIMSFGAGGARTIGSTAQSQGPLVFLVDAASGLSETVVFSIEKGQLFPGAPYILKLTPLHNLAAGATWAGPASYHRFTLPSIP